MQLNPRQLEAFQKVMLTGSMTTAAELLKVSQPAVSRLIRDLEDTLSFRLFRREGNRLIPGAEAQRLFREVDRFYQGMGQIERVAHDLKAARTGTLRVGAITSLGLDFMNEGIRRFTQSHPDVVISLDVRHTLGILELAAANQIDIGYVGYMGTEYPGVDTIQQRSMPAVCVVPRTHSLARKRTVLLADLQGEKLISLSKNSPLRMRLDMALEAAGVTCLRPIETTFAYAACGMVARGLGITVSDPFTTSYLRDSSIVSRPINPPLPFAFSVVLPSHQLRSRVVQDFIFLVDELLNERMKSGETSEVS